MIKLDVKTLEFIKSVFDIQLDMSTKTYGYKRLCELIKERKPELYTSPLIEEIMNDIKNEIPVEFDKSEMIRLTPVEILNIAKMGAKYWSNAKSNDTKLSIEEVCKHHVDVALGILLKTDPDRFEHAN
jgi:hypothetical protein